MGRVPDGGWERWARWRQGATGLSRRCAGWPSSSAVRCSGSACSRQGWSPPATRNTLWCRSGHAWRRIVPRAATTAAPAAGRLSTHGPGDCASAGAPSQRRGRDFPAGNPGCRGAAGNSGQQQSDHGHHAYAGFGFRTGTRVSAHRRSYRAAQRRRDSAVLPRSRRRWRQHLQRAGRPPSAHGARSGRPQCNPQLLHHLVVRCLRQGITGRCATEQPIPAGRRAGARRRAHLDRDAGPVAQRAKEFSPAPAACTPRRCSLSTAPCWSSARTSAGTTRSTR